MVVTVSVVLAIAGAVLVILGIVGGGISGQIGLPKKLSSFERTFAILGGLLLLIAAYFLDQPFGSQQTASTQQQEAQNTITALETQIAGQSRRHTDTPQISVPDETQDSTRTPQPTIKPFATATEGIAPTDEAASLTNETASTALTDPTIPSRTTLTDSTACNTMEEMRPHHNPQYGVPWVLEPYSEDRIIEVWSNHHPNNLDVHLYFLPAGESAEFLSGGGVEYRDRPDCDFAAGEYERKKNNPRPPIDDAQYQEYIANGSIP